MIWTTSGGFKGKINKQSLQFLPRMLFLLAIAFFILSGYGIYVYFHGVHTEKAHPLIQFKTRLKEVCAKPRLPIPEYRGMESVFKFITSPDKSHCYSWLEFGGEQIVIPTQEEKECMDEIRKTKMICFNEEYQMTKDPCLVYSFTKDADQQFERDMHMFSCNVHVFDAKEVTGAEHVKRTEFWMEHGWEISEYPYDHEVKDKDKIINKVGVIRRRSLDFITHVLGHERSVINFVKSDHEGREWILLKQIITHHNLVDVQQIGVRVHFPLSVNKMTGTARHEYFKEIFEIFQGLSCLGYKYVLGRPAQYYKGTIKVPETEKKYFVAYEMNFAKVINSTMKVK